MTLEQRIEQLEEKVARLERIDLINERAIGSLRVRCEEHGIPAPEFTEIDAL